MSLQGKHKRHRSSQNGSQDDSDTNGKTKRVAFIGNSILYFNDCPRLLQHMMGGSMIQDSCLRGGANLSTLWSGGNGMKRIFGSPNGRIRNENSNSGGKHGHDIGASTVEELLSDERGWDFVIMNDHTQFPARLNTREQSIQILETKYAPLLRKCDCIPIFLQTAAYRYKITNGAEDLGDTQNFTRLIQEGLETYMDKLAKKIHENDDVDDRRPRMAPVGNAYLSVHNSDPKLWEKLFCADNFHPTPHGTWLQACVLYCTILNEAPPDYDARWWDTMRYRTMDRHQPPFPTKGEAAQLREVAIQVCGINDNM